MTANTISTADLAAAQARNEDAWRRSNTLLRTGQIDEFMTYWCDDATYEAALPVAGLPAVITGHEALHATFTALVASAKSITVHDIVFHQTTDPDVAIVEERMVGELLDGDTYENRIIMRMTFREGRIAHMLEYYGQLAHQDLLRKLGFTAPLDQE